MTPKQKAPLVTQDSPVPTRKYSVMLISGILTGAAFGALRQLWPDHPFTDYEGQITLWVALALQAVVGYFTRNRYVTKDPVPKK